MVGSVPPRSWLIRRRAAALLARAAPLLLDCGDGTRLEAWHSPQPHNRRASDGRRLAILLHGWEGNVESPYVLSAAALHRDSVSPSWTSSGLRSSQDFFKTSSFRVANNCLPKYE